MLPAGLGLLLCSPWPTHILLASFQEETPKGPLTWLRKQESCCGLQMARGLAPLRHLKCRFHPQVHPQAVSRSPHPQEPRRSLGRAQIPGHQVQHPGARPLNCVSQKVQ